MKNYLKLFFILLIGNVFLPKVYAKHPSNVVTINITGIVFDSKTLLPLENVDIYNEQGDFVTKTDDKGYFVGKIKSNSSNGSLKFKIRLEKKEYLTFTQSENWADSQKEQININYFFGIRKGSDSSEVDSFSQYFLNNDNSFNSVSTNLESVLQKLKFNNTINVIKKENQNSFFEINKSYYLVSDTGWLKLDSPESLINIDLDEKVQAKNINHSLQRKNIKDILHTESGEIKIVTYKYEK